SSIHSADECDDVYGTVRLYVPPVVLFRKSICQLPGSCSVIETVTESPACTARGTVRETCGSVSIQALYWTRPDPSIASSVPAWIRSRVLSPPIPTQAASAAPVVEAEGCGTVQVPVTEVN